MSWELQLEKAPLQRESTLEIAVWIWRRRRRLVVRMVRMVRMMMTRVGRRLGRI